MNPNRQMLCGVSHMTNGGHLCDECMKLIWPNFCHKLESIFWLLVQVCRLTTECQVYQFVPSTSISEQFVCILWTILQLIQVPPIDSSWT